MSLSAYFYDPFHDTMSDSNRLFDAVWDSRMPRVSRSLTRQSEDATVSGLLRPR